MDQQCDNKKKRNRSRKKKSANVQPCTSSVPETPKRYSPRNKIWDSIVVLISFFPVLLYSFSGQPVVMSSTIQQKLSEDEFCQLCFDAIAAIHDKSPSLQSNPPTRLPVAKGFINSGNTCFLNCVVQSLFSTPLFLRCVFLQSPHLLPTLKYNFKISACYIMPYMHALCYRIYMYYSVSLWHLTLQCNLFTGSTGEVDMSPNPNRTNTTQSTALTSC